MVGHVFYSMNLWKMFPSLLQTLIINILTGYHWLVFNFIWKCDYNIVLFCCWTMNSVFIMWVFLPFNAEKGIVCILWLPWPWRDRIRMHAFYSIFKVLDGCGHFSNCTGILISLRKKNVYTCRYMYIKKFKFLE